MKRLLLASIAMLLPRLAMADCGFTDNTILTATALNTCLATGMLKDASNATLPDALTNLGAMANNASNAVLPDALTNLGAMSRTGSNATLPTARDNLGAGAGSGRNIVTDYGASPTGAAPINTALQSAIDDACNNATPNVFTVKEVVIPDGYYVMSNGTITITNGCWIHGEHGQGWLGVNGGGASIVLPMGTQVGDIFQFRGFGQLRISDLLITTSGGYQKGGASYARKHAGGSGYAINDTITLTGGTFTTATVLKVTAVSGGAVTGAVITTPGTYSVAPSATAPVAQGSTSGGGSGATFDVVYANGSGISVSGPATTLTGDAASGTTTITVASTLNFFDGHQIAIEQDDGTYFTTSISGAPSGSTIHLAAGLTFKASANHPVYDDYTVQPRIENVTVGGAWDAVRIDNASNVIINKLFAIDYGHDGIIKTSGPSPDGGGDTYVLQAWDFLRGTSNAGVEVLAGGGINTSGSYYQGSKYSVLLNSYFGPTGTLLLNNSSYESFNTCAVRLHQSVSGIEYANVSVIGSEFSAFTHGQHLCVDAGTPGLAPKWIRNIVFSGNHANSGITDSVALIDIEDGDNIAIQGNAFNNLLGTGATGLKIGAGATEVVEGGNAFVNFPSGAYGSINAASLLPYTTKGPATVGGALTTNITGMTQCVHANSAGILSGTGADCGSGGGGGGVDPGTEGQIGYYANTGSNISGSAATIDSFGKISTPAGVTAGTSSTYNMTIGGSASYPTLAASSGATGLTINPNANGTNALFRLSNNASTAVLEAVDHTAVSSYEDLALNGATIALQVNATPVATVTSGGISVAGSGQVAAGSFTDGFVTWQSAQINRTGAAVEMQYGGAGDLRIFGSTTTPTIFSTTGETRGLVYDIQNAAITHQGATFTANSSSASSINASYIWSCNWLTACTNAATANQYDVIRGVMEVPSGSTNPVSVFTAYVLGGSQRPNDIYAYAADEVVDADNSTLWGAAFACTDNRGHVISSHTSRACIGIELDANITATGSEYIGLLINGYSLVQGGPMQGVLVVPPDDTGSTHTGTIAKFGCAFCTADGSSFTALQIGAAAMPAAIVASQPVVWQAYNSSASQITGREFLSGTGALNLAIGSTTIAYVANSAGQAAVDTVGGTVRARGGAAGLDYGTLANFGAGVELNFSQDQQIGNLASIDRSTNALLQLSIFGSKITAFGGSMNAGSGSNIGEGWFNASQGYAVGSTPGADCFGTFNPATARVQKGLIIQCF